MTKRGLRRHGELRARRLRADSGAHPFDRLIGYVEEGAAGFLVCHFAPEPCVGPDLRRVVVGKLWESVGRVVGLVVYD